MKYFENCKNQEEAKKLFRKLAVQLHPDKGGSHTEFIKMQAQYESFLKGNYGYTTKDAKQEADALKNFVMSNEWIKAWDGVTVELTGSWVWLCGNTYQWKEEIKEKGFKYSKSKKKWYLAPYEIKRKKRGVSFNKIKSQYGYDSMTITADTSNRLN